MHQLYPNQIVEQRIQIRKDSLLVLNDFQKLLENVNCLWPHLKFATRELKLCLIVSREMQILIPWTINWWGTNSFGEKSTVGCFTALLWQKGTLMWIHLSSSPSKVWTPYYEAVAMLIKYGRIESWKYFWKRLDETFIS